MNALDTELRQPGPEGCMTCSRLTAWKVQGVTRNRCSRGYHLWGDLCAWRDPLPEGRRVVAAVPVEASCKKS